MHRIKAFFHRRGIALAAVVTLASLVMIGLGAFRLITWSKPMAAGNYSQAVHNPASLTDKAVALYDRGVLEYQQAENATNPNDAQNEVTAAQNDLNAAYEDLENAGGGTISPSSAKLASVIEFRLGNINVLNGLNQQSATLIDDGVQDYEQCLRLDPTNLYAKYNIELLEQSSTVNGKGNPAGPGKPGKQKGGKPGSKPGGSQAGHSHDNGT